MKKAVVIAVTGIVLLVLSNIYYYRDTYFWQIDTQRHILKKELLLCTDELDQYFKKTQTNVMLLLSKQELDGFFENPGRSEETRKRFELLYNRYADFLQQLRIYNRTGENYTLRRGAQNMYISTLVDDQSKDSFIPKTVLEPDENRITFTQPLVSGTTVFGMVEFVFDMKAFFKSVFHSFNLEQYQFQYIVTSQGNIIYATLPVQTLRGPEQKVFYDKLRLGKSFDLIHEIKVAGKQTEVLTVFHPLSFKGGSYFVAFSLPTDLITISIARNAFVMGAISMAIVLGIMVVFGFYIKKRVHADKLVKLNQEALRKMIYYLPAGILLIDNHRKIVSVNRAFLKLFDFEDEDLLVGHPAEESLVFSGVKLVNKEKFSDYSFKYAIKNGPSTETLIINEKIPYYLERKRYLVDVYTEIPVIDGHIGLKGTHHKAQTAFIANISHELRTPLNGIIGMTDLLGQSKLAQPETDMLSILKRSADTLLSLINDILDFSKIESGKFDIESTPFDIKAELENTLMGFLPLTREKHITLTWHIPLTLPVDFIGDPMRFRQVLNNLLSNAIKFTDRGKVHVLVSKTQLLNGNSGLLFSIKDTGIGIAKEKQKFIFNSFYQADESSTRRFGGTGLGTTISKELVHMMGGEIWVNSPCDLSSDPDQPGCEFCFTLPLKVRKLRKTVVTTDIRDTSHIRSMVITDDILHVQTICRNFAALKIDYTVMAPTQETLDQLRTSSRYHLLVIDNRPDFSGIDFMQALFNHQLHKNFIILFQSNDNQKSNTNLAKRLGADAYLRKPIQLVVLREFILNHFPHLSDKHFAGLGHVNFASIKILVAEDNKLNQRVAQNLFKKIGFEIDLANNGVEALDMIKNVSYDIIFMDIFMPVMDGLEAARLIKINGTGLPVVAMTASNDPSEKQRAMDAGMDDYISKPARAEDLLRMITKWCVKPSATALHNS